MSTPPERLVVVGHGMAAHRLCERVVELRDEGVAPPFGVVVIGGEPRPAYDRVHLTSYFEHRDAGKLELGSREWYAERGIDLVLGDPVAAIDRSARSVETRSGRVEPYDRLVLATGSSPFVPPIDGVDRPGVFVYRTIEDLEAILAASEGARSAAVLGGGLLGLEAAKAVHDLGLETHVIEFAPRLMARQLDDLGASILQAEVASLGVGVRCSTSTDRIEEAPGGGHRMRFADGGTLDVDLLVVSAGIRPNDAEARAAGLEVGTRGGIVVDDAMRTSDPRIQAIGECASHDGQVYGLIAPVYQMAETAAYNLAGRETYFTGADLSTELKLLGVDVATVGESLLSNGTTKPVIVHDALEGVYKKLIVDADRNVLRGAILVGDTSAYRTLRQYFDLEQPLPTPASSLILGSGDRAVAGEALPDAALVCSCNHVSKGDLRAAIVDEGLTHLGDLTACTRAGAGCGGCVPQVKEILRAELTRAGISIRKTICEHFPYSRKDLYAMVKVHGLRSYEAVLERHGTGTAARCAGPPWPRSWPPPGTRTPPITG